MTPSHDVAARWRVALHEAGHAVAALALTPRRTVRAVLLAGGGGLTFAGDAGGLLGALVSAAGPAAERLAALHPAPPLPSWRDGGDEPLAAPVVDGARGLACRRLLERGDVDGDLVTAWCTRGGAGRAPDWRRWREELVRLRWAARRFVREHANEILAAAARLYVEGELVLRIEDLQC